jgi:hypothetical protein
MAVKVEKWRQQVDPYFGFLPSYGFRFEQRFCSSSFWTTRAAYAAGDRAVAVDRSVEFNRAEVVLLRLQDGEMPQPEVWVASTPLNIVRLDNVLEARAPGRLSEIQPLVGLGKRELREQLSAQSAALRDVAEDFLTGSFAALEDGEHAIRQRVDANPQELVVWLPADATSEDEHRAVEEARATAPTEVNVVAKRYSRPER